MMEALSRLLERAVGGACRGLQLGIMQLRYLDRCVFLCVCVCVCVCFQVFLVLRLTWENPR